MVKASRRTTMNQGTGSKPCSMPSAKLSTTEPSDAVVTDFGTSFDDVANVHCLDAPAFLFENVVECAAPHDGACDDDCGMVVPHNCEPGMKDFAAAARRR